jgi:hypothetical protein
MAGGRRFKISTAIVRRPVTGTLLGRLKAAGVTVPTAHGTVVCAVRDAWFEMPIRKQWTVAFRLIPGSIPSTVAVAEVRVFPTEDWEGRAPGSWSADYLGPTANAYQALTNEVLAAIRIPDELGVAEEYEEWRRNVPRESRSEGTPKEVFERWRRQLGYAPRPAPVDHPKGGPVGSGRTPKGRRKAR